MDEPVEIFRPGVKSTYYLEYIFVEAAKNAQMRVLARLNGERIDINCRDEIGRTALHWASQNGHFDIMKYLLANKAHKDVIDGDLITPLHLAAANQHLKCVQLLILAKANINACTKSGCRPKDLCPYESDVWWVLIQAEEGEYPNPHTFPGPSDLPFVPKYALPTRPVIPDDDKKRNALLKKIKPKKK